MCFSCKSSHDTAIASAAASDVIHVPAVVTHEAATEAAAAAEAPASIPAAIQRRPLTVCPSRMR